MKITIRPITSSHLKVMKINIFTKKKRKLKTIKQALHYREKKKTTNTNNNELNYVEPFIKKKERNLKLKKSKHTALFLSKLTTKELKENHVATYSFLF